MSRLYSIAAGAALAAFGVLPMQAQAAPNLTGDYTGMISTLHVKVHIKQAADGTLSGSLDSLDQGAMGIECADFHLDGQSLSFTVPAVHGSWKGTVSADGNTLTGTWNQGSEIPLKMTRDTFVATAKPSQIDGIWLGELDAGGTKLRIQLTVKSDDKGREYCAMDSLDQRAMGLECDKIEFKGESFSFEVPSVHGEWSGKLSADGKALNGSWNQGTPLVLNFVRQLTAIAVKPIPPPTYDAAMPPVSAADLEAAMAKDLAKALQSGELAPSTGIGVSIGVVEHGVRRVFSFGAAKPDSIFEIGSMTKTFTGLILAQMVAQGKVKLDEPVRELLPPGTVAKPAGAEITLLDLATQHSGLPRMPDNFKPADNENPYADYRAANLYAFLSKQGVAKPADAGFLYSNLGFGTLGQALAVRAGVSYPELLKREVTGPLGLADTTVALTAAQQARFMPAHTGDRKPAHAWDLDAMAGAGAIRSTAGDMLSYLEAQLHPENVKAANSPEGATLRSALEASHQLRADAMPGMRIALAWLYKTDSGEYWHNGATGGYSSYGFFNPRGDYAAVVLVNETIGEKGSYADRVGEHVAERLAGKPAISLAD